MKTSSPSIECEMKETIEFRSIMPRVDAGEKVVLFSKCIHRRDNRRGRQSGQELAFLRDFAKRLGLEIVGEFKRGNESRKDFRRLMQYMDLNPDCRTIVVMSMDTFSENPVDLISVYDRGIGMLVVEEYVSEVSIPPGSQPAKRQGRAS